MTLNELILHYGTQSKAAKALGFTRAALSRWKKLGEIPTETQCFIEIKTRGRFKADREQIIEVA